MEVRENSLNDVTPELIQDWINLESRALEPNIYLSPHFCLPAIKELTTGEQPLIISIYNNEGSQARLVGLTMVVLCPPSRDFPFKHLVCFESIHSYLGGLLLDRAQAQSAALKFFEYLAKPNAPWHGLRINHWFSSGEQGTVMLDAAKANRISWHGLHSYERACIEPLHTDTQAYQKAYQVAGGKDLDRRVRRLKELGEINTRVLRGKDVTQETVDQFLKLEDREWTRETKTSLLAAGHANFFKAICQPLMEESRIFVSEILLNGKPVASALNFVSGNCGFAFKIGWDQSLAKMSPGIVNELWFMRDLAQTCGDLIHIDSGASEGSFIEKLWPGRKTISTGVFITSRRAIWVTRLMDYLRLIKKRLRKSQPE